MPGRPDFRREPLWDRLYERRCHEPFVKLVLLGLARDKVKWLSQAKTALGKCEPGRTMHCSCISEMQQATEEDCDMETSVAEGIYNGVDQRLMGLVKEQYAE